MRIDLVLPPGRHSWNLGQGWINTLQRMGLLGRTFHATPKTAEQIIGYAKAPESDLVILMGGDHHLPFLHDTTAKREAWKSSRVPTAVVCYESILDTRFPGSIEKSQSAIQAFTHFVVCDEKDEAFFRAADVPVEWMPQCVDPDMFKPGIESRLPKFFFRGKYDLSLHYGARAQLLKRLSNEPDFHLIPHEMSDDELAQAYRTHAGVVNLPNNFMGYNVRTFEALASGCLLLQSRILDRPRNEALFTEKHFFLFDPGNPDELAHKIREMARDPGEFAEMARAGREACLADHTIEHRTRQLIAFVERSWKAASKIHIGCGDNVLPGFLNTDARNTDPRVTVQDASTLPQTPHGSAVMAYACHILEHFPRGKVVDVLEAWRSKLRPGGELFISVPDARYLATRYLLGRKLDWVLPPLFGGQEYEGNFHYTAFDRRSLRALLLKAGYQNVRLFDPSQLAFTRFDCSRWPLSLNVVAQNPPVFPSSGWWTPWIQALRGFQLTVVRYLMGLTSPH